MALDKIQALSGPPGHSLTDTPNKWAWDKPSEFSNPDDALDYVIEGLEKAGTKRDLTRMMAAGVSIEELVTQIGFKGFMEGFYTPDVAELIKPSIAIYLMGLADDNGFTPVVFTGGNDDANEYEGQVDDQTFYSIMKERNPEMFAAVLEEANEDERMRAYLRQRAEESFSTPEIESSQSFLDVPDNIPFEADIEEEDTPDIDIRMPPPQEMQQDMVMEENEGMEEQESLLQEEIE